MTVKELLRFVQCTQECRVTYIKKGELIDIQGSCMELFVMKDICDRYVTTCYVDNNELIILL